MSLRAELVPLADMLGYAEEGAALATGLTLEEFVNDRTRWLAATACAMFMGEAARRLSDEVRAQLPEIPFVPIVAMRNRLIHGYDVIAGPQLFRVLTVDMPATAATLRKFLSEHGVQ